MNRVEMAMATGPLSGYVNQARKEPLVVTRRGRPVAAVVPIKGVDLEALSLSTNSVFIAIIARARARYKAEGGISIEDMRRKYRTQVRATRKSG